MALDERLHRELERTARPADPTGVYEHLIRRHERRKVARRIQAGGLALIVLLGTIAGFFALTRVFGGNDKVATTAADANGQLALSLASEPSILRIALINPDRGSTSSPAVTHSTRHPRGRRMEPCSSTGAQDRTCGRVCG